MLEPFKIKIGFTCGTMDLCHTGHIRMLEDCKSQCNYLIVAVQTDPTVDRPNKNKPVQSIEERVEQVRALRAVDEVITYTTEKELYELLLTLNYDLRFIGSDWEGKQYTGIDISGHSEKVRFHDRTGHSFSSTELRRRIFEDEMSKVSREFLED